MAKLVLGPLLRYVGETDAVLWVETDAACEVEVLGNRQPTFTVAAHHYALVVVDGLEPGSRTRRTIDLSDACVPVRVFEALARLAGVPRERVRWRLVEGPFYDNQVAMLTIDGRSCMARLERTIGDPDTDERGLHTSFDRALS
jgi:hypothetical protein